MRKILFVSLAACLMLALVIPALLSTDTAQGAPAGAPTPVTFSNNGGRATGARVLSFFDGTPQAALTPISNCFETGDHSVIDLQWTAAQAAALTVTLTHGNDASHQTLGQTLINSSSTPVATPSMQQYPLFGLQQCIRVQSVNATPVGVYVKGLAK